MTISQTCAGKWMTA